MAMEVTKMSEQGRLVIVPALTAINFRNIDRVYLPLEYLKSERDLSWFNQFHKEVISYFKSFEVNDYLKIFFPNLQIAEDEKYVYNINDTVIMITPKRSNIRSFNDIEVAVIYKGQYEC